MSSSQTFIYFLFKELYEKYFLSISHSNLKKKKYYTAKVLVQYLHVALYDFEHDQLVVMPVDQDAEKEIGVALIHNLVVFPLNEIARRNASG